MISTILLNLIVFFLPTQLGLHFWPTFSRAAGVRVDYLSPTVYFADILLFLYIFTNIGRIFLWLKKNLHIAIYFVLFVFINLLFSISPLNSLVWWSHIFLYLLFFLTLRLNNIKFADIRVPLLYSTTLIISLEFLQFVNQSSLNGIFYFLGERSYSASSSGLGHIAIFGRDIIRPMSTFSHANSLAGYLLVVYYLLDKSKSPLWQKILILLGILLTMSKAAILAFILVIFLHLPSVPLIIFFLGISFLEVVIPGLPINYQSISDRLFLLDPAKKIIFHYPLFGVGLGNFIPAMANYLTSSFILPSKLQPVHDLPLLFISETGILGLLTVYQVIRSNVKKISKPVILGLFALIIVTGTFDHYWWTLPQDKLILLLAIAVLL